ncbi:MAG: proline--tRNA ligase, partial [Candidatus Pacebacteria bacterium]|nr:proline--tRNA ligase [Candidatus Paceibacterota bacterium]
HATHDEADERAKDMLKIYKDLAENYMAIPVTMGQKSESEKFAGALRTYTCEAMMQDGKALQFATSHNLGQNFATAFDVKFTDQNGETVFCWQTSWGLSTRSIGGLIMTHSDDKGLVLPPKMASIQAVITTIAPSETDRTTVGEKANELKSILEAADISCHVDNRELRPGEKYFEWEKKGVPVRIELGPKDIANNSAVLVRRDTGEKKPVALADLSKEVATLLEAIQSNLFERALALRKDKTVTVDSWEEFQKEIEEGKFVMAHWSGDAADEAEIKKATTATIRCIPFDQPEEEGKCVFSGKPSSKRVIFAKAY